jgi:hypothetical protein
MRKKNWRSEDFLLGNWELRFGNPHLLTNRLQPGGKQWGFPITILRTSVRKSSFFKLSNPRFLVSFLRFGISNLTNFKAFLDPFERLDFFSSASLRSASGKGRTFWWGRRAEKGSVFFFTLPFKNLVESKTVWYYETLGLLSSFGSFPTHTWPVLLLFYCFHIV